MKKFFCILLTLSFFAATVFAERQKLNESWHFHLGDLPHAHLATFDDTHWRILNIPHDWAFENGYHRDGAQSDKGGYACGGIGWYRKHFILHSKVKRSNKIFLDFDAVYRNADVWLNGHYLGHCSYGYLPFSYEVCPYIKGGENVLAVRVDNSKEPSARWYHGCGIYGNVHLRVHGSSYFEKDGTFVEKADQEGNVKVKSVVQNAASQKGLSCEVSLLDKSGTLQILKTYSIKKQNTDTLDFSFQVSHPALWSPESPHLYTLRLSLYDARHRMLDEQNISVGFRDMAWSVEKGFFLNGKSCKLRGVCEHLEGGPVGAMYTPQLMRWKLQLLKDMGCNAIRTAHNPQLPFFYDLCDEMGLLVMDEVFDGWKRKANHDYGASDFSKSWEQDLRSVIRRDRNHPSIFLYSVGNETQGPMAADLVRVCHEEDFTRKVTSGSAGSASMDIYGMNGGSESKVFLENYHPKNQPFIATENPHTWQVRGYYRTKTWYRDGYRKGKIMHIPDLTENEIFSYDWISPKERKNNKQIFNSSYDNATVRVTARHILEALHKKEWFSGSFRWTGFDYLGEAGYVHGGWPFRAFQSGALDLAGFPKDLYYLYQSEWTDKNMVHILPHWTHPMMKLGTKIPVWVYTTGDEVELFLNGKPLGKCRKGHAWNEIQCQFMVPWTPGVIEAVAYRNGIEIARSYQKTADAPSRLGLTIENENLRPNGEDVSIISLREEDASGTFYPYGENRIYVKTKGPAKVLSFENGSPVDTTCNYNASSRCCFFGRSRLFIQSTGGKETDSVSVMYAAILGDKKLKQSDKVSIICEERTLRGSLPLRRLQIYYTTDGSHPCRTSKRYSAPFAVSPGTQVQAAVYDENTLLFEMSERFGPNEGLYWGTTEAEGINLDGDEAENMVLSDCEIRRDNHQASSGAYVIPRKGKGSISWYQENDGGRQQMVLVLRYSLNSFGKSADMRFYNNEKSIAKIKFDDTEGRWKEQKVKMTLLPGANQLLLKCGEADEPLCIDLLRIE